MIESRYTNRCGICALNWPYTQSFKVCPQCGEECRGLNLNEPDTLNDHIMDYAEAEAYVRDNGLDVPTRPIRIGVEQKVRELYNDLENWMHELPPEMKGRRR